MLFAFSLPTIVLEFLSNLFEFPRGAFTAVFICFLLITIANPLVQSCFRPDVKNAIKCMIKPFCIGRCSTQSYS